MKSKLSRKEAIYREAIYLHMTGHGRVCGDRILSESEFKKESSRLSWNLISSCLFAVAVFVGLDTSQYIKELNSFNRNTLPLIEVEDSSTLKLKAINEVSKCYRDFATMDRAGETYIYKNGFRECFINASRQVKTFSEGFSIATLAHPYIIQHADDKEFKMAAFIALDTGRDDFIRMRSIDLEPALKVKEAHDKSIILRITGLFPFNYQYSSDEAVLAEFNEIERAEYAITNPSDYERQHEIKIKFWEQFYEKK